MDIGVSMSLGFTSVVQYKCGACGKIIIATQLERKMPQPTYGLNRIRRQCALNPCLYYEGFCVAALSVFISLPATVVRPGLTDRIPAHLQVPGRQDPTTLGGPRVFIARFRTVILASKYASQAISGSSVEVEPRYKCPGPPNNRSQKVGK